MRNKINIEELDKYRAFLSNCGGEIGEMTAVCLKKANSMREHWQDEHIDEVVNELVGLKNGIDKFSENCERYCRILQEMTDRYRQYLSGKFKG